VIFQALKDYFLYLGLERRASEATIRAYEGDITQFLDFLRGELSREAGFVGAVIRSAASPGKSHPSRAFSAFA
jgi:site-specific recombinase XerD